MSMAWVKGATAVAGIGASLYGANKQSQDTRAANEANIAAQKESERQNWLRYLLTRGVQADPSTASGAVPTSYRAVNTKLPLWANVVTPQSAAPGAAPQAGGVPQLVRIKT